MANVLKQNLATIVLVAVAISTGFVLRSNKASADVVVDEITVTIPVSCSMGGVGQTSHNATLNNGEYSASSGNIYEHGIGTTTLTTFCNDVNGFSIYAIGHTNNTYGNNTLVGASTSSIINTGVYSSGDTTSKWSMKVDKVTDATAYNPQNMTIDNSFDNWHSVPNSYTKVAHYQAQSGSSATDTILGGKVTTTYATYIAGNQSADTYTGQVSYIMVHPSSTVAGTYSINYNANGGSGTMTGETGILNFLDHTIKPSTFTPPTGKVLTGWCTTNTSQSTCTDGTLYKVGGIIPASTVTHGSTLNLYAIWNDPPLIYDLVAAQLKNNNTACVTTTADGKCSQTLADMQAAITEPTSTDPALDTSNSGVYKYNATLFGMASDSANTSDIYYFRGILDKTYKYSDAPNDEPSGIPSSGDSAYYQNYVILDQDGTKDTSDTCWRIVRTTGSGGTKMIYNGNWNATDGCARAQGDAEAGSTYFNRGGANTTIAYDKTSDEDLYGTRGYIAYVGYNYNDDYKYAGNPSSNSFYTTASLNSTLFKNTNSQGIMIASNLKTTIENWYQNTSNLPNFSSKLETSAGWCNDRSTTTSPTTSNTTVPYAPGSTYGTGGSVTFGARYRNYTANRSASLACPNTTGQDLLSTGATNNVSNGLTYPLAPLTEDEVVLAGHGYQVANYPTTPSNYSSRWSYRSFLRSGSSFWLLSPGYRASSHGRVYAFVVRPIGSSGHNGVWDSYGVRPAISLTSGTTIAGGGGTAADPWVVRP